MVNGAIEELTVKQNQGREVGEFKGMCFKCKKTGHRATNCPLNKKEDQVNVVMGNKDISLTAMALTMKGSTVEERKYIFSTDSRVCTHMVGLDKGLIN